MQCTSKYSLSAFFSADRFAEGVFSGDGERYGFSRTCHKTKNTRALQEHDIRVLLTPWFFSQRQCGTGYFLSKKMLSFFLSHYFKNYSFVKCSCCFSDLLLFDTSVWTKIRTSNFSKTCTNTYTNTWASSLINTRTLIDGCIHTSRRRVMRRSATVVNCAARQTNCEDNDDDNVDNNDSDYDIV